MNSLHRLDQMPFGVFHTKLILALGTIWIFDGYEVSLFAVAGLEIEKQLGLSGGQLGLLGSAYLLGCVLGAILFSVLSLKMGRRSLFWVTLSIYIMSTILFSLSSSLFYLLLARLLTGLGVGGEYTAIFAAIDELVPAQYRGRVDIMVDGTWHLGSFIAYAVTLLCYSFETDLPLWRYMFLAGALGAIPVLYLRSDIPESPRWLIHKGRHKQAHEIIQQIVNMNNPSEQEHFHFLVEGQDEPDQQASKWQASIQEYIALILQMMSQYPRRVVLGLSVMTAQAFFYNGVFYTYALVLQKYYDVPCNSSALYMLPISLASFIGPILLGRLFDTVGRRIMMTSTYLVAGISVILAGVLFQYHSLSLYYSSILWFWVFLVASPAASSAHLTISELFPVQLRTHAMAFFFSLALLIGGVFSPLLFASLLQNGTRLYIALAYSFSGVLMIAASLVTFFLGVDAENRTLEQLV